jgi:chemotaxis protein MotB
MFSSKLTNGLKTAAAMTCVCLAAMLGGGCNKEKQLEAENTQLRSENESLQQANQQLTAQNQQFLSEISNRQAQPVDYYPPGGNTGGGGRGGFSGGGGGTTLTVAGDVAFNSGKAVLTAAGKKELDGIAKTIKSRYPGASIRVEGYTDSDPIRKSNWASNEALSQARAEAVEKYLVSRGLSGGRIEAVGRGAANPKSSKAASRRVEIVVMQ